MNGILILWTYLRATGLACRRDGHCEARKRSPGKPLKEQPTC